MNGGKAENIERMRDIFIIWKGKALLITYAFSQFISNNKSGRQRFIQKYIHSKLQHIFVLSSNFLEIDLSTQGRFFIKSLFHSGRWNFASCTIRLIYQVIAPCIVYCIHPTLTCNVFSSKPLSLMMCATFSFFSGMGYLYNAKRVVQEMLSQGSWIY